MIVNAWQFEHVDDDDDDDDELQIQIPQDNNDMYDFWRKW